jgi:hypothetical protein
MTDTRGYDEDDSIERPSNLKSTRIDQSWQIQADKPTTTMAWNNRYKEWFCLPEPLPQRKRDNGAAFQKGDRM